MACYSYELCFTGNDCHILNHTGGTACTSHLHGNLYLINIQIAGSKKICATHPKSVPQDNNKVEYALTAHTCMCKTTSATQNQCPSHPHTNTDKNNITFDNQGGTTAAAHTDEGFTFIVPLLAQLRPPSPHHALHTTSVNHGSESSDACNNDPDVAISMHTGLSITPLAARGHVESALATWLCRQWPDV